MRIDASALVAELKRNSVTMATAESCTGGGIGQAVTAVPGSSAVYLGGVISYTNAVKANVLGVPQEILDTVGAVSRETACAMANGVRLLLQADIGISVTGLAGPDGDGSGRPVGLVYLGCSTDSGTFAQEFLFSGDRGEVRRQAVQAALELTSQVIRKDIE